MLISDHKPLSYIFGPKKSIPAFAADRMQRWALLLTGYNFNIEHVSSADNAEADCLSRLPCERLIMEEEESFTVTSVEKLPITAKKIAEATQKDPILSKVFELTSSGWPSKCMDPLLEVYFTRRYELTLEDGCIVWGTRVIVPEKFQAQLLLELHECHPGICKMKLLARSYVWWPTLEKEIDKMVGECTKCTKSLNNPQVGPLIVWPWSTTPWERLHMDYLEIDNKAFLLVVDSFSKWIEVDIMNSTTSSATIKKIRMLFARYGLPQHVVTDNGPQFISEEFKLFMKENGIKFTLTPTYHPASNGLAERHVQTFKNMFKKLDGDIEWKTAQVLLTYRNLVHGTTGKTPAELFLGRSPRIRLSLAKPNLKARVEGKQMNMKEQYDKQSKYREFIVGQSVQVRNYRRGQEKWGPGVIESKTGPSTFVVRTPENPKRLVQVDQMVANKESKIE